MSMRKPIPIVILTKDEPRFLKMMIASIIRRTKYPFKIFIVDNASKSQEQKNTLNLMIDLYGVEVIFNKKNEWLLGFNAAIHLINNDQQLNQDEIILSDGDIIVPIAKGNVCWLEYLKESIDNNIVIGKVGLGLDLTYLKGKKNFSKTLSLEKNFMLGPIIGDFVIAPVDTTLAIYRKNLFITDKFKMLPGHASLVRPYYYTVRTKNKFTCKHLGWRAYQKNDSKKHLDEKVFCFTRYAAYINPLVIQNASLQAQLYHRFLKIPFRMYWGTRVAFLWGKYFIKRFPRGLNEITDRLR